MHVENALILRKGLTPYSCNKTPCAKTTFETKVPHAQHSRGFQYLYCAAKFYRIYTQPMNDVHVSGGVLFRTFYPCRRRLSLLWLLSFGILIFFGAIQPSHAAVASKKAASVATKKAPKKNVQRPYVRSIISAEDRAALKERGISSGFGPRIVSRKTTRMHKGIDIPAPRNSKIVAFNDGEVTFVGRKNGYGTVVIIRQIDGRDALYAHMNKAVIKRGEKVKRGTHIGHVGRTGRATGYHLHFELIDEGEHLDPAFHVWHGSELVLIPGDLDPTKNENRTNVAEPSRKKPTRQFF